MDTPSQPGALLPPELMAEVEAIAAIEHRPAREMLREAVERYVKDRRAFAGVDTTGQMSSRRTAREAGARMLARRQSHPLPPDMTIRDLTIFGRA